MNEAINSHNQILAHHVVEALKKNNFAAQFVNTKEEAVKLLLEAIPQEATVGMGGSWTVQELGLTELLESRGNTILNHNKPGLSREEVADTRHKQLSCDVFLTGTNAITLDGQLVNKDGVGNRVAAMIFGPKKIIIIVGVNKIVRNLEEAQNRIELFAAPINCKRLNKKTPCVQTGECMDCQSPDRICNVTTILHKRPATSAIEIIVVGETLGF